MHECKFTPCHTKWLTLGNVKLGVRTDLFMTVNRGWYSFTPQRFVITHDCVTIAGVQDDGTPCQIKRKSSQEEIMALHLFLLEVIERDVAAMTKETLMQLTYEDAEVTQRVILTTRGWREHYINRIETQGQLLVEIVMGARFKMVPQELDLRQPEATVTLKPLGHPTLASIELPPLTVFNMVRVHSVVSQGGAPAVLARKWPNPWGISGWRARLQHTLKSNLPVKPEPIEAGEGGVLV